MSGLELFYGGGGVVGGLEGESQDRLRCGL